MTNTGTADHAWIDDCPLPVLVTDSGGRVIGASAALERTTGVRREELVGRAVAEIRSPMARSLCGDEPLIGFTRPGGVDVWLHRRLQALAHGGHTLHWLQDVGEAARLRRDNEELRARVRQLDLSDRLTGLPTRRDFDQALIQQVTRSRRWGDAAGFCGAGQTGAGVSGVDRGGGHPGGLLPSDRQSLLLHRHPCGLGVLDEVKRGCDIE